MNKNNTAVRRILPLTLASLGALGGLQPAAADILLYDKDETTFSTDGYFNAFYVNSDVDRQGETYDRRQSRVKMGFLPNYIGFNFGRKIDELSLGGRASFWVTINDSETDGTDTAIDVRQFYGTVAGDWGEVLIGKDFGLFSRSNI
ncbi:TPA: porin, partial [Pseudomonas aeruginosa]|nr:porin [Pseudomonas aeruginosa]HBO0121536.1 porin [Pseudomonas aeruginosa]HBO0227445.1 porin [Pseudomonas aeruginosa]